MLCKDCMHNNNSDFCDDCIPYDPYCTLFRQKQEPVSDPASELDAARRAEPVCFAAIYEHIMTETCSSHFWQVKKE